MKKIFTIVSLLLICYAASAQQHHIDSLLAKIDKASYAQTGVLLGELHTQPGGDLIMLDKGKAAYQIAESAHQSEKKACALLQIITAAYWLHNPPGLLPAKYYLAGAQITLTKKDTVTAARAYSGLRAYYANLKKSDSARFFSNQAFSLLLSQLNESSELQKVENACYAILAEPQGGQTLIKYANRKLSAANNNNELDEEKFLLLISVAYLNTGNDIAALDAAIKGMTVSKKLKSIAYQVYFTGIIGNIYFGAKDYARAIKYGLQSIKLSTLAHDTIRILYSYSAVESCYNHLKRSDSAYFFARKEYQLAKNISNTSKIFTPRLLMIAYGDLVEAFTGQRNADSALFYHRFALPLYHKLDISGSFAYYDINVAKAWLLKNQVDSAEKYAFDAYSRASLLKAFSYQEEAAGILAKLYEGRDNLKSLHYYKAEKAATDSLNTGNRAGQFQLSVDKDLQRQQELRNAQAEYQSKLIFYATIATLAVVLLVATILWHNNKKQKKANHLLALQKEKIQQTLQDLKATQQQLIQSEKMASLGELTAGIAHEIQNPLNFVNNFSEVSVELLAELKEEEAKGNKEDVIAIADDLTQNLEKIRHHGKRADAIVKGMLQHSQSGSGTKEPTNINSLADEYLRLSYHGLRSKDKSFNAEMVRHFDENLPKVNVIPQDIGRVLLNLFNNAFYAVNQKQKKVGADYQPEVTVTTSADNDTVVISVKDNGTGIPDSIKDKIMQPFFTTKPTGEGTGLGLSLSYDIVVKGHAGKININSKGGEGSEFTIILPLN
jgi:two-component system NtrC family sensor kinase